MGQGCCVAADCAEPSRGATEATAVRGASETDGFSGISPHPPVTIDGSVVGSLSLSLSQSHAPQHVRPQHHPRQRVVSFSPFTRKPQRNGSGVDARGEARDVAFGNLPDESYGGGTDSHTTATAVMNPLSIEDDESSSLYRDSHDVWTSHGVGDSALLMDPDCEFPIVDSDTPYAAQLAIRREDEPQRPMDLRTMCGERF